MPKGDNRVTDNDEGYDDLKDRMKDLDGSTVTVGFHQDEVESEQVLVASVHEFGAPDAGIPERSFMRSSVRENSRDYGTTWGSLLKQVVFGQMSLRTALSLMGEQARADIQQKIVDVQRPPLAPETIRQKKQGADVAEGEAIKPDGSGGDTGNPLIDTGNMRQSVNYKVHIDSI